MPEDVQIPRMYMHASATRLDLTDLKSAHIRIEDIAHNLSRVPRFNGNTVRPYSVAEHSVMVFEMLQAWGFPPSVCLQGLLHDATEYVLGDVPAPVKAQVPEIRRFENEVLWPAVAGKFGLDLTMHAAVKHADWIALYVEAKCLCTNADLSTWERYEEFSESADLWIQGYGRIDPTVQPHPEAMERAFIEVFNIVEQAVMEEVANAGRN